MSKGNFHIQKRLYASLGSFHDAGNLESYLSPESNEVFLTLDKFENKFQPKQTYGTRDTCW